MERNWNLTFTPRACASYCLVRSVPWRLVRKRNVILRNAFPLEHSLAKRGYNWFRIWAGFQLRHAYKWNHQKWNCYYVVISSLLIKKSTYKITVRQAIFKIKMVINSNTNMLKWKPLMFYSDDPFPFLLQGTKMLFILSTYLFQFHVKK